jgi:hypothetical protein
MEQKCVKDQEELPEDETDLKPLNFNVNEKDVNFLIKPSTDQFIKQMTPNTDPNVKKPSPPDNVVKAYAAIENLIKNKMKASSNEHSIQDYAVYDLRYMI